MGRLGVVLLGMFAALALTAAALVFIASEKRFARRFDVDVASIVYPLPTDARAVAEGKRLAATRGCLECHGANGEGRLFLDQMPIFVVRPTNLTPGGPTRSYSNEDWARAVRYGVRPDGTTILFMPCEDFAELDDVDLGAIVAFFRSLPKSENDPGPTRIGPLGRALFLAGELPLLPAERIAPRARVPLAPHRGVTVARGEYLAQGCTGCHGPHLSGGPIPGVPPEWPAASNLTPDSTSGFSRYSETDFITLMREGRRPNGSNVVSTYMPWPQFAYFTDDELASMFAYLQTTPPQPFGRR